MEVKIDISARTQVEVSESWRELGTAMPWIEFPTGWKVRMIPPFSFATTRFMVENEHGVRVSIYSDHYGQLGAMDEPYWEIYPVSKGLTLADEEEPQRFLLNQVDAMIATIATLGDPVHAAKTLLKGTTT